jgi:hypothetical protein
MKRSFTKTTVVKMLCLWLAFASPFIINAQCPTAGSNWTVRTAPANTWNAVAYGNGKFVAVGSGSSDYVMTSPDGITWTARTAPAGDWRSIAFGNGKFVAVGVDNVVISSTDGITWTTGTAIEYTNWTSVTYGDGLFVAVSDGGFSGAMVSLDGILWFQVSGSGTSFRSWRGITYGNGMYVAVGSFAAVVSSSDGNSWTSHNIPTNADLTSVTYGNGTFVAVADGGFHRVVTSSNGADWTTQTAAEEIAWQSVTYGNGTFVAVSSDGSNRVMTSQDGSNWTIRAATEANTWRSVTFGNNLFVAVSSDGTNRVMTSAGLGQPTISIVSDQGNTISSGTSVTFTATITSGGATPTYQWKKNNVNVGTNSATYTDAAIANNDVITCVVNQTPTCAATSNSITMSVCSPPALSIVANPGTSIVAGTSVTFTATPTNGGAMPSYQWVKNGFPVGSNSTTYTDATLVNNDFIYCEMTISQACNGIDRAFSNFIEMTVCTPTSPSISIAASTDTYMPSGTSVTFTATPTLGGTTPAYQWKKNNVNVGSNSATYTTTTLANNDVITCVLTSNNACASPTTATSNSITITICPSSVTPTVSIVSNTGTNINFGTSVTFTATPTNGGSTPTYQWKKNGTNVGSNSTTYTDATLVNNDVISCVLTSSTLCASPTTGTSNSLTMSVNTVAGEALNFDGVDDFVTLGSNSPPVTAIFTLEAWVNPATGYGLFASSGDPVEVISRWGNGGAGNATYRLGINSTGKVVLSVFTGSASSVVTSASTVPTNTWTHIAGVRAADNSLNIYINGVLNATLASALTPQSSTYAIYFGKPIAGSNRYKGSIDEVRIWNVARTATEIQNTRNGSFASAQSGLVAYYKFNQGITGHNNTSVTTLIDDSGNNRNGTLTSFSLTGTTSNWVAPGGVNSVLPVELVDFTGKNTEGGNLLTWTTANEVNNKGFQVERLNGNDWQNIGFIAANNKAGTYQFIDNAPLSMSYYRLRQIDNDGKETLSKVVSVSRSHSTKLKAYPNPVSNVLTIETTEAGDYHIFNLLGQEMLNGKTPSGGRGLDVSVLPQGTYFLKVGAEQVKFVKH